ncbi:MAG: hypothetical protein ACYTF1_09200 [Planctomycetota bacterium]|jgi:hypothetical protein
MSSNRSPTVTDFFNKITDKCLPHIERFTVPFYGIQDDQVKHDRTGVLYCIADHYFILTASHYLRAIIKNNIPLYIPQSDPNAIPFPLVDAVFHSTEVDNGRDVAAIKLSEDVVSKLRPTKEFLKHSRIDQTDDGRGLYIVFGYPMAWTGMVDPGNILSHPLIYASRQYEGECYSGTFYDPNVHILLEFDQNVIDAVSGNQESLPSIKGISGCGIWRVADWNSTSIAHWSPRELRLVGLQHRWIKDDNFKYIQGTWIKYALQLILNHRSRFSDTDYHTTLLVSSIVFLPDDFYVS